MDKQQIISKERENDGKSVFLYYNATVGAYLAFGLSAYYTTMITEPFMSYSDEMDMPVAMLGKEHVFDMRKSMEKIEHQTKLFYHFEMTRPPVGTIGYDKWAAKIKERHQILRITK